MQVKKWIKFNCIHLTFEQNSGYVIAWDDQPSCRLFWQIRDRLHITSASFFCHFHPFPLFVSNCQCSIKRTPPNYFSISQATATLSVWPNFKMTCNVFRGTSLHGALIENTKCLFCSVTEYCKIIRKLAKFYCWSNWFKLYTFWPRFRYFCWR